MNGKDIIRETKELNLPSDEYTVVGSGALAVRGLREAQDVDLLITADLYEKLKSNGWSEEHFPDSKREWVISSGPFDASTSWLVNDYEPDPLDLIESSDVIEGIRFVSLANLLTWKKACKREKDLRDIELIEKHLAQKET